MESYTPHGNHFVAGINEMLGRKLVDGILKRNQKNMRRSRLIALIMIAKKL